MAPVTQWKLPWTFDASLSRWHSRRLLEATTTFKPSKASGAHNIPTEFGSWDMRSNFVVLQMGSEVFAARYEVADMTWEHCHTPVVSKGDPASCKNYRPISRVSYKFFVSILLNGEQALQTGSGQGNSVFGLAMLPFCFAKRMLVQSSASKTSAPRFLKLWMAQTPSISYHAIGSFSLCTAISKCVIADIRRRWSLNIWTCLNVVHRRPSFCSTCFVLILFLLHAFAKISLVLVNEVETKLASKLTYLNYDDTLCGSIGPKTGKGKYICLQCIIIQQKWTMGMRRPKLCHIFDTSVKLLQKHSGGTTTKPYYNASWINNRGERLFWNIRLYAVTVGLGNVETDSRHHFQAAATTRYSIPTNWHLNKNSSIGSNLK